MADNDITSSEPPAASTPAAAPAASAPAAAVAPKAKWTRYLTPALALVAALIVGGVAGVLIGQSTASSSNASSVRGGFGGAGGYGGFGGQGAGAGTGAGTGTGAARGGFTSGTISAISGDTITVKLADGSTVKVTTSGTTTVTKSSTAKVSDLAEGETITVVGQADSSGDVTATRISEGTGGLGGFGGARPGNGATAAPGN
jgi:hypothetical protein